MTRCSQVSAVLLAKSDGSGTLETSVDVSLEEPGTQDSPGATIRHSMSTCRHDLKALCQESQEPQELCRHAYMEAG
eukprot:1567450-Amphidinium_carterae.1